MTVAVTNSDTKYDIQYRDIDGLVPYERNSRKHPKRQIEALVRGIKEFGFGSALAVWKDGMILAGHGRVEAARLAGLTEVPCMDLSELDFNTARAFVISDNKINDLAGWDDEIFKAEIEALKAIADSGADFAMADTGFSDRELIKFLPNMDIPAASRSADPERFVIGLEDDAVLEITVSGDIWHLGKHKILCGDPLDPKSWVRLMSGAQAQLLLSDPAALAADLGIVDAEAIYTGAFTALRGFMEDGGSYYISAEPGPYEFALMSALEASGFPLRHALIWEREGSPEVIAASPFKNVSRETLASDVSRETLAESTADGPYGVNHALLLYGWVKGTHTFYGPQNEPTIWRYPDAPSLPSVLLERVLRNSSQADDIVIADEGCAEQALFACENRGRAARLVLSSPADVDRLVQIWARAVRKDPTRSGEALSAAIAKKVDE